MKKYIVILLSLICFSTFAETYDIKVIGKALIKDKDGIIIELEKEDVIDDKDQELIVQPSSRVKIIVNGETLVLKNGEYKLSDIFKK